MGVVFSALATALTLGRAAFVCLGGFDASRRQFQSGMGLSRSSSELATNNAPLCCRGRDRRDGKRCGGFLADGSEGGRDVRCGTHFGAASRAPPPARGAPLMAQLQTQSEQASVSQTQRADASSAVRPQGAAVAAHASSGSQAASEPGAPSTTQSPPSAAALAEAPRIMTTEAPPARALVTDSSTAAAPGAAPAPAPAPRAVMKKPRAVARAVQPRYDLPRYAAPRYEPRYNSMQRGPYAFLRQYGSYGQEY